MTARPPDGLSGSAAAEAALAAVEEMSEAMVVLDADLVFRYANRAALALLGRTQEQLLGHAYGDVLPEAVGSDFELAYRRVLADGQPTVSDAWFAPWERSFRQRVLPCSTGVTVLFHDTTAERRRTAGRLEELEVLEEFVSHADAVIVVKDVGGRYLFVNEAGALTAGCTPQELIGRTAHDFFPREHADSVRAHDLQVQRSERPMHQQETIEHPPGVWRTYQSVRFPVFDAHRNLAGTGAILTDVSPWRETQRRLEASEQRLRDVFATTSLCHLVIDRARDVVLEANPAAAGMLALPLSELVGSPASRYVAGPPDRLLNVPPTADGAVAGHEVETEVRRRDGTTVPVLATVSTLADTDVVSCILRDLTPLRELQARLVDAERLEAVGSVAGGIAHDVNNILAAVNGYADLLEPAVAGEATDARNLAGIHRSVERAADLVDRLLAFARRQDLEPTDFDLAGTVTDLADMCRRLLPDGIDLAVDARRAVTVRADLSQVQQVLLNLVVNARDALPDGGSVTVAVDEVALTTPGSSALPAGRYARARVVDDGVGMAPDVARRCFEPFFTTRRGSGGHGLGLSTAFGVARQSGGDLRVDSAPGDGTTFTLLLPLSAAPGVGTGAGPDGSGRSGTAGQAGERPAAGASSGAVGAQVGVRVADPVGDVVLVVDDDPDVLDMASQTLRRAGHVVRTARDGDEATEVARELGDSLLLLVTDVNMPRTDGPTLVARLRGTDPDLPVLLVSATAPDPAPADVQFLAKPFRAGALTEAVAALAERVGRRSRP